MLTQHQPIAVNPSAAAKMVGVSRSTLYRWMSMDGFPVVRIGGCVRIPVDDLLAWIRGQGGGDMT